jgi:hypothetical protein
MSLYEPVAQGRQSNRFAVSANFPGKQLEQAEAAVLGLAVPMEHDTQLVDPLMAL